MLGEISLPRPYDGMVGHIDEDGAENLQRFPQTPLQAPISSALQTGLGLSPY